MNIKEAMLRNVLLGRVGSENFTIKYSSGYVVFEWSSGKTTRLQRAANGVDSIIPLPDGSSLRLKPDFSLM
ncbi:MAG: hypothetical protein LBT19_01005 [Candidatus Nomurabacteria bacterium]|jgi:hypothetical protein|nr:hypothetical protein [Candidatus Nomurabacteria bacterium]